jgi:hypothetical protein
MALRAWPVLILLSLFAFRVLKDKFHSFLRDLQFLFWFMCKSLLHLIVLIAKGGGKEI